MMRLLAALMLAVLAGIGTAGAQNYPSRPVTIIVPFAAGGATDVLTRFLAERMRAALGQTIVIENVTVPAAPSASAGRRGRRPTATPSRSAPRPPTC
jgi:tripartite-type tricarboxylate transporter receptor subunit TctC